MSVHDNARAQGLGRHSGADTDDARVHYDDEIFETSQDARQGYLDRPVLLVVVASLAIAIISGLLVFYLNP